jgi:hypothetical protein
MKQILSVIMLSLFAVTISVAQTDTKTKTVTVAEQQAVNGPVMKFETETIDYGNVPYGSDGTREFVFTNTGTEPLIISAARGSCGCTVPTFPKEPIMPGETAKIKVKYDTMREGGFTKYVSITSNEGEQEKKLTIKGNVLSKPKEESVPSNNSLFNGGTKG